MSDGIAHWTTDHEQIRRWVEERGGRPATVATTADGDWPGILRIDFPGHGDEEALEPIDWAAFFAKFEQEQLAFTYEERTASGEVSRFSKRIRR
ncbi:hypothetical protein [Patulibacter defluvii]|uniref:hypothetical protein n=1 Tax=Patulibacter defluvii TaxID=3095358 RepID=UPI002A760BAD|nr:hypothetical protein [Patulibacter sp. DM4]